MLVAADPNEAAEQLGPQPLPLIRIGDQDGKFGLLGSFDLGQPGGAEQVPGFRVGIFPLRDQRHLAIIIDKADPGQTLVGDPLAELQRLKETEIDALVREGLVEPDHQRLVFRPDRTDRHRGAVFQGRSADVLGRVGADGQLREIFFANFFPMNDDAGIECDLPILGDEKGIDVDLLDPWLLDDQPAESDEELLQRGEIDRPLPRTPSAR